MLDQNHFLDGMVRIVYRMIAEVLLVVVAANNDLSYRERNLTARKGCWAAR